MIKFMSMGRTGNILLQNVGISIISKKFDFFVENYVNTHEFQELGLELHMGKNKNHKFEKYYDYDLMALLGSEYIENGILYEGTFQVPEFIKKYDSEVLSHFNLRYQIRKNQVFVHVRLGDVVNHNPGINYYRECLNKIEFEIGYISSDSPNHEIVRLLIKEYNLNFYDNSPIGIINFAKDFDNLVLSKGTFSWWIGFLSKSNNIWELYTCLT